MVKEELKNEAIEKEMEDLRKKERPTALEQIKLVRYYINVYEHPEEKIMELLSHWDPDELKEFMGQVHEENAKQPPKRYFVSLKEPLEDTGLR